MKKDIVFKQAFTGWVLEKVELDKPWYWLNPQGLALDSKIKHDKKLSEFDRDFAKHPKVLKFTACENIASDYLADVIREYVLGESEDRIWRDVTFTRKDYGLIIISGECLLKNSNKKIAQIKNGSELVQSAYFAKKRLKTRDEYILGQALSISYCR